MPDDNDQEMIIEIDMDMPIEADMDMPIEADMDMPIEADEMDKLMEMPPVCDILMVADV